MGLGRAKTEEMRTKSPIKINPAHKGDLHSALKVPQDKKIPEKKLEKALKSSKPRVKKMAVFAENAKHFKH